MTARANCIPNYCVSDDDYSKPDPARPRSEYRYHNIEDDPFPNPTLLEMVYYDQSKEVTQKICDMVTGQKMLAFQMMHCNASRIFLRRKRNFFAPSCLVYNRAICPHFASS